MPVATCLPKAFLARIAATGITAIVWLLTDASFATAQGAAPANLGTTLPNQMNLATVPAPPYFAALTLYQAGKFAEAAATLSTLVKPPTRTQAHTIARRVLNPLAQLDNPELFEFWASRLADLPVDDICYFTMRGECNYQLGNYTAALLDYQAALATHLGNPYWVRRLEWRASTRLNPVMSTVSWGRRGTLPGDFPATVTLGGTLPFFARSTSATRNPAMRNYAQHGPPEDGLRARDRSLHGPGHLSLA